MGDHIRFLALVLIRISTVLFLITQLLLCELLHDATPAAGVRVGDFNGKNLGTVGTSQILIDAVEVDGVQQMQQWYNTGGATQTTQNLSRSGGKTDRRVTTEMMMDEVRSLFCCCPYHHISMYVFCTCECLPVHHGVYFAAGRVRDK